LQTPRSSRQGAPPATAVLSPPSRLSPREAGYREAISCYGTNLPRRQSPNMSGVKGRPAACGGEASRQSLSEKRPPTRAASIVAVDHTAGLFRLHGGENRDLLRFYFARRHTVTVLPPACRAGLSIFSSSPVNVATRFTLEATWFGKELRSIFSMIVLSGSLIV
jgi:hypothetical protein